MDQSLKVQKKYNRIAGLYDLLTNGNEKRRFSSWRENFISPLNGKILEIGIGTGKSIKYYNENCEVLGIDISEKMLGKARERLAKLGRTNITLKQMDAERLELENDSFDFIVTSCVFCSVPDPAKGFKEIRRVLKPSGKLIMMEHVLSKNTLIALIENINNPLTRLLTGVNINRDTGQNILNADLKITEEKNLALFDVFKLFVAKKNS
jgi:demethylmenaquinone methyltransferase/2-methoxy-6-polyprenyl-1,4-benzoquinol methylase